MARCFSGEYRIRSAGLMLSQRNEIGGREIIDATAFERTAATDMAFLQPAIAALRSRNPDKLRAFDDLLFSPRYQALRKLLGAEEALAEPAAADEFTDVDIDEADQPPKAPKKRATARPQSKLSSKVDLPSEDPLVA